MLVVALAFGLLAALPLLAGPGFLLTRGGGDSPFLLLRLHQLEAALRAGEFPVRWMPDAALGYGYPFFSYYAALPYYAAALLRGLGLTYVSALELTQTLGLLLAAGGAYALARALPLGAADADGQARGLSRPQAVLAAAAYTFAPFHLANLYVRGDSLSELWAMGLYPIVLWRLQRCLDRPSFGRVFGLAVATASLVLSHNISALNFMPFVALYLLFAGVWKVTQKWEQGGLRPALPPLFGYILPAGVALAWGLALAAWFWLPALAEGSAVQLGDVTQGYFNYANHFRRLDLVQPTLLYNAEAGPPGTPSPFAMGLGQALAALAGLAALAAGTVRAARRGALGGRRVAALAFVLLSALAATLMITPLSAWAWEHLPQVRYTQFPWRFLSIQALFTALITAFIVPSEEWIPGRLTPARYPFFGHLRWTAAVGLGLLLALLGLGRLRPDFIPVADSDVTPARLQLLEYFSGNLGSTIGYEYLPAAVNPRPFTSGVMAGRAPELKVLAGRATGSRLWQRGASQAWQIEAPSRASLALPTYAWPGWQARIDGIPTGIDVVPGSGWIRVDVPAGTHELRLHLGRTPLRAAAEALSAAALLVPLATIRRQPGNMAGWLRARRRWLVGAGLATGLLAGLGLVQRAQPPTPPDVPLSMDFAQLAFPHQAAVRFMGGAALVAVRYDGGGDVERGQTLRVRTAWQGTGPAEATLSLVAPGDLLADVPLTLASQTQALPPAGAAPDLVFDLAIPAEVPPGAYYVVVSLTEPGSGRALSALTSAGRERSAVHLAPVWVRAPVAGSPAANALATFAAAPGRVALLAAEGHTPAPGRLDVALAWQPLGPLAGGDVVALRLRDAAGAEWAALDAQPAYGFYPTELWREGERVPDFYRLVLPAGTPPGDYPLGLALYHPATGATAGTYSFTATVTAATPAGGRIAQHMLAPGLGVASVEAPATFAQGDAPEVRVGWLVQAAPEQAYRARWTLAPAGDAPAGPLTQTLDLAPGSSPLAWPAGSFVLGRVRLGTPADAAPGRYTLRLALVDEAGQAAGPEVDVAQVEVTGRARSFELPAAGEFTPAGVRYGDVIELWGYAIEQRPESLQLRLAWRALAAPGADYKFFVHLRAPDGSVPRQVDAMPLGNTYPTALWVRAEVVVEPVTLALAGLPPGSYTVAIGWYDPAAPEQRLPATGAGGNLLPDGAFELPTSIEITRVEK